MEFRDIKHYDQKSVSINLINKHLQEIEEFRATEQENKECKFALLRYKHELESNVYHYYKQLHNKSLATNKDSSLHGYVPIADISLCFKAAKIPGTVFVLHPDSNFSFFTNNKDIRLSTKNKLDCFYDMLINAPLPFVFLPTCDLHEFSMFLREIYENKSEFQKNMYSVKIGAQDAYFMEPLILSLLNLEFFTDSLIRDKNIHCLLFGFLN